MSLCIQFECVFVGSYINVKKQACGLGRQMKGESPRNKERLPSPKSNLNPMKVSWSGEMRKSHPRGLREHWEHWILTTSLLRDQHLSPFFLWQAAACPVWRSGRSQEKARINYATLRLCAGRVEIARWQLLVSSQPKGVRKPCCVAVLV